MGVVAAENVNGIDFNIPDGYTFNSSNLGIKPIVTASGSTNTLNGAVNTYVNGNEKIRISVFHLDSPLTLDDLHSSGEKKTINGKEGHLINLTNTVNFEYLDNGYLITVECPSSVSLESIII